MQILILNWRDIKNPLSGGSEISTHEHAKNLVRKGHGVIQFSSAFSGAKAKEMIDGIIIIRRGSHYTVHLHAFIYYMRFLRGKIDFIIDEFHFIPFFSPIYFQGKKLAFIHEAARELWFKNQLFPIGIIGFFLEPFFFKLYSNIHFLTVSNSTKKDLIKFGIKEKYIHIVYNGLNQVRSKRRKEECPVVIYLGRLAKDKGTEDAVLAFFEIQKTFPESSLWIAGREEKKGVEDYLKKLTKKLKIEEKVIFFGFVTEEEKYDLLKRAWVLVHPSIREGWGLTVLEAASQGTPCVAYESSGLRDSVRDGETGFLVKERMPKKLAEKIALLLSNNVLYNNLSNKSLEWSKKFDWHKSTTESLQLIERIS